MTVRNPSPPNEPPPSEDIFTPQVVDTSFLALPGPPDASCSSRDLERGSDDKYDDDKEDTLSTRGTTTTSIATTTTTSSLRDLGTPSVLLPASFHRDPLSLSHLRRMFFDEGNGVVHVKVRFRKELPQKPDELATLDDDLWSQLSANYRAFLVSKWADGFFLFYFHHVFFGSIFFSLLVAEIIPLYFAIIFIIIVDLIFAIWWRKRVKSQAILNNHMVHDFKARFLAQGYNLDCYEYYDYEQGSDDPFTYLCFVIYPSSLDAQAFVRYQGDTLLGEGFGTAHMHVTDFPKEKPKNLVILDDDIWNDYAAKMIGRNNMRLFLTFWLITFPIVLGGIYIPILILIYFILCILACIGMEFRGSKNILEDFTDRFQENGYKVVFVKERGLIVFTPVWHLTDDHDTNTEIV